MSNLDSLFKCFVEVTTVITLYVAINICPSRGKMLAFYNLLLLIITSIINQSHWISVKNPDKNTTVLLKLINTLPNPPH